MSLIAKQVVRTRFRADPDLYRVREDQGALGEAEPIEDEDDEEYEDEMGGAGNP
jgi:hypothetical protein